MTFKIHITFVDGGEEIVMGCDKIHTQDGVLSAYYRGYNSTYVGSDHRGSWPLVNIKKWITIQE